MNLSANSATWLSSVWEVFVLFTIPIGGGIPAGVVLGKARGLEWPIMMFLYFLSDVALACVFEPVMLLLKRSNFFNNLAGAFKKTLEKTVLKPGTKPGPFALMMVAFGVDPMTGRTAAMAAGHGFISGWTIAIIGDLFFFIVVMASTLWLNELLGDGTWTVIIITVAMLGIPFLIRKFRERRVPTS